MPAAGLLVGPPPAWAPVAVSSQPDGLAGAEMASRLFRDGPSVDVGLGGRLAESAGSVSVWRSIIASMTTSVPGSSGSFGRFDGGERPRTGAGHAAPAPEHRFRPSHGPIAAINLSLLVVAVLVTVWLFLKFASGHRLAADFHYDFWVAGFRVVHGLSPYGWTRQQIAGGFSFPYPAFAALLFVPSSLLPRSVGDPVAAVLALAACLSALRIVGVRDWRIYVAVLLCCPVISGWQSANVTLPLVCGIAAMWRYRDSPIVAGVLAALMLCVKPVVWPLFLWLLVTRRFRAAAYGVAVALAINLISWAVLGFGQISVWWHLLMVQTDVLYRQGYGFIALGVRVGAGRGAATVLTVLASAAVGCGCLWLARNRREQDAFTLAIVLMIVASPLADNHYFVLLLVPLAVARPNFSRAWLVPLVLWLCPGMHVAVWQLALWWVTLAGTAVWLICQNESTTIQRESPTIPRPTGPNLSLP
jgi:hypothetical protein